MNLITKAEASRILGISEVAVHHWQNKNPRPDFFVEDENGNLRIDTDKESWKLKLNGSRKTGHAKKTLDGMNKKRELKKIVSSAVDGVEDGEIETENDSDLNISQIKQIEGGRFFKGALRQAILKRDGYRCVLCGKSPADGVRLEVDHIVEFEDGGKTTYDNGQTLCGDCNKGKSSFKKMATDEYISQTEFGRRVGVHRNTIADAIDKGIIDKDVITGNINFTTEVIKWYAQNNYMPEKTGVPIPEGDTEIMELNRRAAIASLESEIFNAKIKEEKSKQEEIKTLEIKKELAPMYLVKHFFSFAENMIQRSYRRFQEISPELEALYLGGKREDAVKFLLREQESITRDAVDKLKKSMKEEGYDLENIEK